jgi:hypothetical protein
MFLAISVLNCSSFILFPNFHSGFDDFLRKDTVQIKRQADRLLCIVAREKGEDQDTFFRILPIFNVDTHTAKTGKNDNWNYQPVRRGKTT